MKGIIIGCNISAAIALVISSCRKEFSCEGCADNNRPPVAIAGPDQVIQAPVDSVRLDGSGSSDPDDSIGSYLWTKISGPAAGSIVHPNDSSTRVRSLIPGTYQFKLTVTDYGGLTALDTVQVTVNEIGHINRPPIAKSGSDQIVTDSVILDGSGSTDPDNNIIGYYWSKISGPSSYQIEDPYAVRTSVSRLDSGLYLFELTVTDSGGLFSKDTVQVNVEKDVKKDVEGDSLFVACDNSKRPLVDVQLLPVTSLPSGSGTDFVVLGNRIYFMTIECASCIGLAKTRAYYNIYDINTQAWSRSSEFFVTPRDYGATIIAASNKIFCAGGSRSDGVSSLQVFADLDIYDIKNDSWTTTALSEPGYDITGAVAGNKVMFAGGLRKDPVWRAKPSTVVDVFDVSNLSKTVTSLTLGRAQMSALTANGKIYFAGGSSGDNASNGFLGASEVIDIYDIATGTWSTSALAGPQTYMAGIAVGNTLYWAGGLGYYEDYLGHAEIREAGATTSTLACLQKETYWWYGKQGAALLNNDKIVFFTGLGNVDFMNNTRFDIYNLNTRTWSVGQLPFGIANASVFTHNNAVYVVGGMVNGQASKKVFRLVF